MKKVKTYKNYVIAETNEKERAEGKDNYEVFTKEEWSYGSGCRYGDMECATIQHCIDFIDS